MNRRHFLATGLTVALSPRMPAVEPPPDLHRQLLARATRLEEARRARFAGVRTAADAEKLRNELRPKMLEMVGGLPETDRKPPAVKKTGEIEADGFVVERFAFESLPGIWVPALLYRPAGRAKGLPGVLSPCGHSAEGKAGASYQAFHADLARRGFVVLTYDPVGQGERCQFSDERGRPRFGLVCGEHAVLGNPLYLLGHNLARYRIHDARRGLDLLASRPEVDPERLGCAGNSGGGTLTAYVSALDDRVRAAVISCYLTSLPQRMASRTAGDPDTDPEQDLFGFLNVDHAGLLALRVPRPTLVCAAIRDFFPIEGTRATFAEAKRLYAAANAADSLAIAEADERHGLSKPLRDAAGAWLERRLAGRDEPMPAAEPPAARPAVDLRAGERRLASVDFASRHLFGIVKTEQEGRPTRKPLPLRDVVRPDADGADFRIAEKSDGKPGRPTVLLVNGNESPDWAGEAGILKALRAIGTGVGVVDVRGVGVLRPKLTAKGHEYTDPLGGVEANLAANAFLCGTSLLSLRVADILAAIAAVKSPSGVVLVGRKDAALMALLAGALDEAVVGVAAEGLPTSWGEWLAEEGRPVNAASVLPNLWRDFGDVADLVRAARRVLQPNRSLTDDPEGLAKWAARIA